MCGRRSTRLNGKWPRFERSIDAGRAGPKARPSHRHLWLLTPGLGIGGCKLERLLATVPAFCRRCTKAGLIAAWLYDLRHRRDAAAGTRSVADHRPADRDTRRDLQGRHPFQRLRPRGAGIGRMASAHGTGRRRASPAAHDSNGLRRRRRSCDHDAVAARSLKPATNAGRQRRLVVVDPVSVLNRAAAAAAGLEYVLSGAPS